MFRLTTTMLLLAVAASTICGNESCGQQPEEKDMQWQLKSLGPLAVQGIELHADTAMTSSLYAMLKKRIADHSLSAAIDIELASNADLEKMDLMLFEIGNGQVTVIDTLGDVEAGDGSLRATMAFNAGKADTTEGGKERTMQLLEDICCRNVEIRVRPVFGGKPMDWVELDPKEAR